MIPFFSALGDALAPTDSIFNKDGVLVAPLVCQEKAKLNYLNPITLAETVERECKLVRISKPYEVVKGVKGATAKEGTMTKFCLTERMSRKALESFALRSKLKEIRTVETVRLPVIVDLTLSLLPIGYDPGTKVWTQNTVPYSTEMELHDAVAWLRHYFGQFEFADNGRSLSVIIALAVSEYAKYLLPEGALRCAFVTQANALGAGKTIALKMALGSVHGPVPSTAWPKNPEELRKKIAGAFASGERIIVFDNVKVMLDSDVLEGVITSPVWQDRILGLTIQFSWRHESQICISGNNMQIGREMMRRIIICNLIQRAERPEERTVKCPFSESSLAAARPHFLAALYALTRNWLNAGRPPGPTIRGGFEEWCRVIGGIVTAAGFSDPMAVAPYSDADSDLNDFRELILAMASGRCSESNTPASTPRSGVSPAKIREFVATEELFQERLGNAVSSQAAGSVLGKILATWVGRNCAGYYLRHDQKVGARRKYWAEKIPNANQPLSSGEPTID
jgi:hypothetical protein